MSLKISRGVRVWVAAALLLPAAAVLNGSDARLAGPGANWRIHREGASG